MSSNIRRYGPCLRKNEGDCVRICIIETGILTVSAKKMTVIMSWVRKCEQRRIDPEEIMKVIQNLCKILSLV